jgi:hypothetical protein
VLPRVRVQRAAAAFFDFEESHGESWSAHFFGYEPADFDVLCSAFGVFGLYCFVVEYSRGFSPFHRVLGRVSNKLKERRVASVFSRYISRTFISPQ